MSKESKEIWISHKLIYPFFFALIRDHGFFKNNENCLRKNIAKYLKVEYNS